MRTLRGIPIVLMLLAAGRLSATTVIPLSVERLAQVSTQVVEARAVKSWAQWNPAHTLIHTYTRFQVTRTLKGGGAQTIVVRQLGGTVGNITQRVSGVRHWFAGEDAVLFLRPGEEQDSTLVVTGLMQGNFLVRQLASGEKVVSNGMPAVSAYRPGPSTVTPYAGSRMTLRELEVRVKKAVQP